MVSSFVFSQYPAEEISLIYNLAGQKERFDLREDIQENIRSINVIVTTYNLAKTKDDNKFLRRLNPNVSSNACRPIFHLTDPICSGLCV